MVQISGPSISNAVSNGTEEVDDRAVVQSPLETIKSVIPNFSTNATASSSSSSSPISSGSTWPSWPSDVSIPDDPIVVGLLSALAGGALMFGGLQGYRRYWRRIRSSNDVSQKMLDSRRWIKGRVTSVGDGDNFRLYHTPGPFFSYPLKLRRVPTSNKDLKDETLHIRISGVDAPENAHFGNPSQPHAKESLDWLRNKITGKRMKVQLLRKDQYNRIVGVPFIHRWILPNKPLPVMMLREGMAVVYESSGAEYGPWGLQGLKKVEAQARQSRRGLWGAKKLETPAAYKKRMKMAEEETPVTTRTTTKRTGLWGLFRKYVF